MQASEQFLEHSQIFMVELFLRKKLTAKSRGVVVITTAQLHSTKPERRFYTGLNPVRGVSEIRDGEDP